MSASALHAVVLGVLAALNTLAQLFPVYRRATWHHRHQELDSFNCGTASRAQCDVLSIRHYISFVQAPTGKTTGACLVAEQSSDTVMIQAQYPCLPTEVTSTATTSHSWTQHSWTQWIDPCRKAGNSSAQQFMNVSEWIHCYCQSHA
jgi:hypothetical protein